MLRSSRARSNARSRARTLGLCINVDKAKACPLNAISVVPLPIIDATPSPSTSSSHDFDFRCASRHSRRWIVYSQGDGQALSPLSSSLGLLSFPPLDEGRAELSLSVSRTLVLSPTLHFCDMSVMDQMEDIWRPAGTKVISCGHLRKATCFAGSISSTLKTQIECRRATLPLHTKKRKMAEEEDRLNIKRRCESLPSFIA